MRSSSMLAVLALCLAVLALATATSVTRGQATIAPKLISLERTSWPTNSSPATTMVPAQHHSAFVMTENANLATQWYVWIRYRGCPVTPQGSIRLTLYRLPGGQQAQRVGPNNPYLPLSAMPKDAIQRSHTVALHAQRGLGVFRFVALSRVTYIYKVFVPSKQGCAAWGLGTTGN